MLNVTDANTPGLVATNALVFGGGAFVYGTGASQDISGLIDAANSTEAVRIDTNGNDISWASYSQELGNAALVKQGGGSLDISVTAAAQDTTTYTGAISVTEGQLTYNITLPAGSQATRVWSGALSIAQGAALQFNEARAVNRTTVLTLSGAISGAGDLILGDKEAPTNPGGGRYQVSGSNTGFTGTFKLVGNGTNADWNEVGFSNAQAVGGASLELDGRGFFVGGGDPVGADIHVTAAGGWINGNSNQTLTLSGALTGEAGANLGLPAGANPTLTVVFTGDLTGYEGTLHSGQGAGVLAFGAGTAATTLASGEFIQAASLGGRAPSGQLQRHGQGPALCGRHHRHGQTRRPGQRQAGADGSQHQHGRHEHRPELDRPAGRRQRGQRRLGRNHQRSGQPGGQHHG
ncbi:MAG: hypothetical protein ACLSCR_02905 [Akkermansia sp.]